MTHFYDFDDFHSDVLRTTPNELQDDKPRLLLLAALGAAGEAGEVADLVKKVLFHRKDPGGKLSDELREKALDELGDVLFYVALGAEALGRTLQHVAHRNVAKRRQRYPEGFDVNAAEKRLAGAVKRPSARRPPKRRGKNPPAY